MSYNGHTVIDSDCHIRQYWDLDRSYKQYVDPEYREQYDRFSSAVQDVSRGAGDSGFRKLIWPSLPGHRMGVYDAFEAPAAPPREQSDPDGRQVSNEGVEIDPACHWDPAIRLRDMDTAGIDISVIFPSSSDSFCALNDVGFESALNRAYHRFISNYCSESDGRLAWIGGSTMRDIPGSTAQLRYWAEQDENFAGMFISRVCPDGTMLDNPNLHPLFELSQDLDLPIWVHGGANRPPYTPWVEAPNALYHSLGGMYAMTALIAGGVFDKFPKLRIGLFEAFGGWMPYLVEKLDDGYAPGSAQAPFLKRKPSEIVAGGQLFCSIESDETQIEHAVEDLGEHIWLFSTDYPHNGTSWPHGVPRVTEREGLSESAKVKLLGENAKRFLPRLASRTA
jgi:predicted TIM-barrel fold metal-dependent hydrolase